MSKQTAVEWLEMKFSKTVSASDWFEKAKQMEKEQMITFGESVCQDGFEEYVAEIFDKMYGGNK
jgi:hypothetical protein